MKFQHGDSLVKRLPRQQSAIPRSEISFTREAFKFGEARAQGSSGWQEDAQACGLPDGGGVRQEQDEVARHNAEVQGWVQPAVAEGEKIYEKNLIEN